MTWKLPTTKLGRIALCSGALGATLMALHWIIGSRLGPALHNWAMFFTGVFILCALWPTLRWAIRRLLWRLRNRLAVAYIFIGVIPIALLMMMGALCGYLSAGQFATYIALRDLQAQLHHLESTNDVLAARYNALNRAGGLSAPIAAELAADSARYLPQRIVTVWQDDKGFTLAAGGALLQTSPAEIPPAVAGDFSGFVADQGTLHLRAVKRYKDSPGFAVVSDIPITEDLLQSIASNLGAVKLITFDKTGGVRPASPAQTSSNPSQIVQAGRVPPPLNRFDPPFTFYTPFHVINWNTGKTQTEGIDVSTRPSRIYSILFATLGDSTRFLRNGLIGLTIFFSLIELAALYIALRLSRSMTRSVENLYTATEHINRGDLAHRIQVRSHDQIASLQLSFNSMTGSLVQLVAEQKEKQRLENELAIAREVQELLFPHAFTSAASLEIYGVCKPARSVSGDYYDFISLGAGKLALAIGDISGKGISAALLMSTVHAFVRAYSLEPAMVSAPALRVEAFSHGDPGMYYRGGEGQSPLSPCMLMTTLSYQLFHCTPPEKFASMFLGCYDAADCVLTYCNAGHLPPIMLREDGTVLRLDTSGTVAGLFDGVTYAESTITMHPGDIFFAFSDGVTEPENESGEFGENRLIELLQQHRHLPLSRIGEAITNAIQDWVGGDELPDDLTVILARVAES